MARIDDLIGLIENATLRREPLSGECCSLRRVGVVVFLSLKALLVDLAQDAPIQ
jgi:hypothetical protein